MNKILTEYQKEFMFQNFFEQQEYAGWKSIAHNLLEKGSCVVAGSGCIWVGGIGNFIKISPAPEPTVGCVKYEFDLETFLGSNLYKETRAQ